MSRTIPHRELRNSSSEVLRQVQAGETIAVTNHGEVVALLVPPGQDRTAGLRVREAQLRGGFAGLPRVHREQRTADVLEALRTDQC